MDSSHSLTHSFIHSFTHSLTHSLTHLLTHYIIMIRRFTPLTRGPIHFVPLSKTDFNHSTMAEKTSDDATIKASELMPCCAVGCCITSYYFEYPSCIGARITQETCCINQTLICCKPSNHPDKCCIFFEG